MSRLEPKFAIYHLAILYLLLSVVPISSHFWDKFVEVGFQHRFTTTTHRHIFPSVLFITILVLNFGFCSPRKHTKIWAPVAMVF